MHHANYKKQEGSYFDTLLNYSISYNTVDSSFRPSNGIVSTFSQELPVLSDGYNIVNGYQVTGYKEVANDQYYLLEFIQEQLIL